MIKYILSFYIPWIDFFLSCCYTYFLDGIYLLITAHWFVCVGSSHSSTNLRSNVTSFYFIHSPLIYFIHLSFISFISHFIHSFIQTFIPYFILIIHLMYLIHYFIHPSYLIHSFPNELYLFIPCLLNSFNYSFLHFLIVFILSLSFIHLFIHSFVLFDSEVQSGIARQCNVQNLWAAAVVSRSGWSSKRLSKKWR